MAGSVLPAPGTPTGDPESTGGRETPSLSFTVLRPRDMVYLRVRGWGVELVATEDVPVVRPVAGAKPTDTRIDVRFTFQHLGERAFFELQGQPAEFVPAPPVPVLAAEESRLVFAIAADDEIPFTVEGVLAALSRLPLLVAPLATARPPKGLRAPWDTAAELPGRLVLGRSDAGYVLARPPRARGARRTDPGDPVRELVAAAAGLRAARRLLAGTTAQDLVGLAAPGRTGGADTPPATVAAPPVGRRFLGDAVVDERARRPTRLRTSAPRAPRIGETAVEAPFRLVLSPSDRAGFAHTTLPAAAPTDDSRVELWHTRLAVRRQNGTVDENLRYQRVVRAIWARDMETPPEPPPGDSPFTMSLDPSDRWTLVRQSADARVVTPEPVEVERLHLSAYGAWLDVAGTWDAEAYAAAGFANVIESWSHLAPMGRDQYVQVVKPGYLFPFGHRCLLIKVTYRKVFESAFTGGPQAYLFQRFFLIVREPTKSYAGRDTPLREVRVRPLVSPDIDPPSRPTTPLNPFGADLFWPSVNEQKFLFTLDTVDWAGATQTVRAPLLFVGLGFLNTHSPAVVVTEYAKDDTIGYAGQGVAFARPSRPADTTMETQALRFTGTAELLTSTPRLVDATVVVPAMRHLAPGAPPTVMEIAPTFVANEFGGANAQGQVYLQVPATGFAPRVQFSGGTDKAGGFISPDLSVEGLSRVAGAVADPTRIATGDFDPAAFFANVAPKLFGLFSLTDILAAVGVDLGDAPSFVTEALDQVSGLLTDLDGLVSSLDTTVQRLADDAATAVNSAVAGALQQAEAQFAPLRAAAEPLVTDLRAAIETLLALDEPSDLSDVVDAVQTLLEDTSDLVDEVKAALAAHPVPPAPRALLERVVDAISPLLAADGILATIEAIVDFVNGFDPDGAGVRARYEWRPKMANFPAGSSDDDALFAIAERGLSLAIEVRASGAAGVGADILAELRDFHLNLLPGAPLMRLPFDRLTFRLRSGRKPEVDAAFRGIEFLGPLAFIDTLRQLIPFDGFSDPPFVDVAPGGVTAGFDVALPNVAVGVFSLENISLGADAHVPFLGEALTIGFNFCSKDRPFRLTVMMIGGGGFVGLRLSPKGLVLLEMSLEAGASLSVDFGVASGSVSMMVGVYLRLEDDTGSLTGYVRIRGEVDVLGLISACITLELSLTYDFASGKMVGEAALTIEIDILCFSTSVTLRVRKQLAGSNGDPTLQEVMPPRPDGTSPAWSAYCEAFAED